MNTPLDAHMIPFLIAAWWQWDAFTLENSDHLPQAFTLGPQLVDPLEGGDEWSVSVHM